MLRICCVLLLLTSLVQAQTVPLHPGWNGVAFQTAVVTQVTANPAVAGLVSFEPGGYVAGPVDTTVNTTKGFWVFATTGTNLTYAGQGQASSLTLRSGYNLVSFGNSSPLPGASLVAQVNGQAVPLSSVVLPTFTQINADDRYVPVDVTTGTLQPGRPYWVFATGPVQLSWSAGTPPASFNLLTPTHRDSAVTNINLTWEPSMGASTYTLEVATTPAFGNTTLVTHTGMTSPQDTLNPTDLGGALTPFFWRVTAVSAGGTRVAANAPYWFSLPVTAGTTPTGIATTGSTALVVDNLAAGAVRLLSLANGSTQATLPVGPFPQSVAVRGGTAVVTNRDSLSVISLGTLKVLGNLTDPNLNASLRDVVITPDGTRAVAGDTSGAQTGISVFNLASLTYQIFFGTNTTLPSQGLALTPDGSTVYVGLGNDGARTLVLATGVLGNVTNLLPVYGLRTLGATELLAAGGPAPEAVKRYTPSTVTAQLGFSTTAGFRNLEVLGDQAVAVGPSSVGILDLSTNTVVRTLPLVGGASVALYTNAGGEPVALVTVPGAGQLRVLSLR